MASSFPQDPFPSIQPALLNSADIQAYQAACDILKGETIDPASGRLKAASYKILCRGDVFWRDDQHGRVEKRIEGSTSFTVPRNGIVFISPQVEFNLPDFIAARFNLTISLVHQGLLLGTGPLVDPGYKGRLLIPLHNLTSRDVSLVGDDGLIWVEFTKTSTDTIQTYNNKTFNFFQPNAGRSTGREIAAYFRETGGVPVRSTLHDNANRWEKAVSEVNSLKTVLQRISWAGALGICIAVGSLIFALFQTYGTFISMVQQNQSTLSDAGKDMAQVKEQQRAAIDDLKKRIEELEKDRQIAGDRKLKSSH